MQKAGLGPDDIKCLNDLKSLPFTTRDDLRDNYPFRLFALPTSEIIRLHASSGTTGKSIVVGYTRKDLAIWSDVVARTLTCPGVEINDFIQIAYGLEIGETSPHYMLIVDLINNMDILQVLVEHKTIERSEGKARRVIDKRELA